MMKEALTRDATWVARDLSHG